MTSLLRDLQRRWRECFAFPEDEWAFAFVAGSGTLINLMAAYALGPMEVHGDFRWMKFTRELEQHQNEAARFTHNCSQGWRACVYYETSVSRVTDLEPDGRPVFCDMVSAFPYYHIPDWCEAFTTVSGKMLGAPPGLGIFGIRRRSIGALQRRFIANRSPLDLALAISEQESGRAVHTPPISLWHDLKETLRPEISYCIRSRVDSLRKQFEKYLHPDLRLEREDGPVMSIKDGALPDWFCEKHKLYRGPYGPQLFLYQYSRNHYLFEELI
jgi:hypothetical protein